MLAHIRRACPGVHVAAIHAFSRLCCIQDSRNKVVVSSSLRHNIVALAKLYHPLHALTFGGSCCTANHAAHLHRWRRSLQPGRALAPSRGHKRTACRWCLRSKSWPPSPAAHRVNCSPPQAALLPPRSVGSSDAPETQTSRKVAATRRAVVVNASCNASNAHSPPAASDIRGQGGSGSSRGGPNCWRNCTWSWIGTWRATTSTNDHKLDLRDFPDTSSHPNASRPAEPQSSTPTIRCPAAANTVRPVCSS